MIIKQANSIAIDTTKSIVEKHSFSQKQLKQNQRKAHSQLNHYLSASLRSKILINSNGRSLRKQSLDYQSERNRNLSGKNNEGAQSYGQKCTDFRKMQSLHKKRSLSIDQGLITNLKNTKANQSHEQSFESLCLRSQYNFIECCRNEDYNKALQYLIVLMNHSIDINRKSWFFHILHAIAEFYYICENYEMSLKFYLQIREGAILQKQYKMLIKSFIGISRCCDIKNLFTEGLVFLKKGLEYAWLSESQMLQSRVYDEIGRKYYRMGDLTKANQYHLKYSTAVLEPHNSPLKGLSSQSILEAEEKNILQYYDSLSALFLVHLTLPYRSTRTLPNISYSTTARQKLPELPMKINVTAGITSKVDEIQYQIKKQLKGWLYAFQTEQPAFQASNKLNQSPQSTSKSRKFAYIDFKMNQHLRMKGIKPLPKSSLFSVENSKQERSFQYKRNLDERVEEMIHQPGLQKNWYSNMVKRVQNDQKRKMNHIDDPIILRKQSEKVNKKLQLFKLLYKQISDFARRK